MALGCFSARERRKMDALKSTYPAIGLGPPGNTEGPSGAPREDTRKEEAHEN